MPKIVKFSLINPPRTMTKKEWEQVSQWLRLCENHTEKLNLNNILYNIMIHGRVGQASIIPSEYGSPPNLKAEILELTKENGKDAESQNM